mmetsp:Transcript_13613/g.24905  ORF Transcript_13613/g.24905 Transcript_13613/m.24905 type:complete len:91 (-) Transcript_13613:59-331(-)
MLEVQHQPPVVEPPPASVNHLTQSAIALKNVLLAGFIISGAYAVHQLKILHDNTIERQRKLQSAGGCFEQQLRSAIPNHAQSSLGSPTNS